MTASLPVPRVVVRDAEVLEARARTLAAGAEREADAAGLFRAVTFRLRGGACAVDAAAVARAVVLAAPFPVPLADGSERLVAFVDERPLAVADLAGEATGISRGARDLAGAPALVVETAAGPVAVVVEGPLDLCEDRLCATAAEGEAQGALRVTGQLAGGAALLDAASLSAWAGRAARP